MTWHDFTWLDNRLCQCTCDETVMSQHPGSHLLIISSVLCKDGNDNYEQLVHWGESGSNVWMYKDSTSQTMNQVMTPFQQRFGNPCLCGATLSLWEKVCLCRGIWRILLRAVDQYSERWRVLWLPLSLNDHYASLCRKDQRNLSTTFDHVWPQEGPGDEVILASVCNRTQQYWHETPATQHVLCWIDNWVPCFIGKFSFQISVQFAAAPYL